MKLQTWYIHGLERMHFFSFTICQHKVKINKQINLWFLWFSGAIDLTKYSKLSGITDFCSSQSNFCNFLDFFFFFFSLNILKRTSNKTVNSWMNEKLSIFRKLRQQHCILKQKIDLENLQLFLGLVPSSK